MYLVVCNKYRLRVASFERAVYEMRFAYYACNQGSDVLLFEKCGENAWEYLGNWFDLH